MFGPQLCAAQFYNVLGVSQNASQAEIKSAYYKMSKLHHPDVSKDPSSHKRFTQITEAYETLGDEGKRREYDQRFQTSARSSSSVFDGMDGYGYAYADPEFYEDDDDVQYYREETFKEWEQRTRNRSYTGAERTNFRGSYYHWNPFTKRTDNPVYNDYGPNIGEDFDAWYKQYEQEVNKMKYKIKKDRKKNMSQSNNSYSKNRTTSNNHSTDEDYEYIIIEENGCYKTVMISLKDLLKKYKNADEDYIIVDESGNLMERLNELAKKMQHKKQSKRKTRSSYFKTKHEHENFDEKQKKPRDSDSHSTQKLYEHILNDHDRLKKKLEQYEDIDDDVQYYSKFHGNFKKNNSKTKTRNKRSKQYTYDQCHDSDISYEMFDDCFDKNRPNVSARNNTSNTNDFEDYVLDAFKRSNIRYEKRNGSIFDMENKLRNRDFFSMPKTKKKK